MKRLGVFTAGFVLAAAAAAQEPSPEAWAELKGPLVAEHMRRVWVPMRDGVRLDANILIPAAGDSPFPAILVRSPYPDERLAVAVAGQAVYRRLLENGYAIVYQSERGRYWSEGEYTMLAGAGEDGYDTVDWIVRQPWSNGKVGTLGCSSSAENQLALSTLAHPAHVAAVAEAAGAGIGRIGPYREQGTMYRGGVPQLFLAGWYHDYIFYGGAGAGERPQFPPDLTRQQRIRLSDYYRLWPTYGWGRSRPGMDYEAFYATLPVEQMLPRVGGPITDWNDFIRRAPDDPAWAGMPLAGDTDTFGVPMLWAASWYDVSVAPNVALYTHARDHTSTERASGNQFLVIGPMTHCRFGAESDNTVVGDRELGDARFDYAGLYLDFFDHWMKGVDNGVLASIPPVQYYQMGANRWMTSDDFPPGDTRMADYYLSSVEGANSRFGDGRLSAGRAPDSGHDEFTYDPARPVPTHGGPWNGQHGRTGALDQSDAVETRHDVLVYTSDPLAKDLSVTGYVEVVLYVSSDARDTDFTVKLVDVDPDGRAWILDDTIMRARYREGFDQRAWMTPGEIYRLEFAPMITANTFRAGHRIRIEISSSNFPRYGRNLNTGGRNFDESAGTVARNSVHFSPDHRSRIRLPITP